MYLKIKSHYINSSKKFKYTFTTTIQSTSTDSNVISPPRISDVPECGSAVLYNVLRIIAYQCPLHFGFDNPPPSGTHRHVFVAGR